MKLKKKKKCINTLQVLPSPTRRQPAELERVLVIISVTLEGSARRLVTIRSALQLTNNLEETVELRLEPPPFSLQSTKHVRVPPCTTYPVPLSHLTAQVINERIFKKKKHFYRTFSLMQVFFNFMFINRFSYVLLPRSCRTATACAVSRLSGIRHWTLLKRRASVILWPATRSCLTDSPCRSARRIYPRAGMSMYN